PLFVAGACECSFALDRDAKADWPTTAVFIFPSRDLACARVGFHGRVSVFRSQKRSPVLDSCCDDSVCAVFCSTLDLRVETIIPFSQDKILTRSEQPCWRSSARGSTSARRVVTLRHAETQHCAGACAASCVSFRHVAGAEKEADSHVAEIPGGDGE